MAKKINFLMLYAGVIIGDAIQSLVIENRNLWSQTYNSPVVGDGLRVLEEVAHIMDKYGYDVNLTSVAGGGLRVVIKRKAGVKDLILANRFPYRRMERETKK